MEFPSPVERVRQSRRRLDEKLAALRPADRFAPPPRGWLKAVRTAVGMSQADLGVRLGVSGQAVQQIEASEADGTVRLSSLRRAAAALDCTLVYALVPNDSLDAMVQARARALLLADVAATERSMALEAQEVAVPQEGLVRQYAETLIAARRLWRD